MLIQAERDSVYCLWMVERKNYIKEIREDRGLSTGKLADLMNTTAQQISNLELGKRKLTWEWILRLANALECQPLDITDGLAQPHEPSERQLLEKFRCLEEPGKKAMFIHMLDAAVEQERKEKK